MKLSLKSIWVITLLAGAQLAIAEEIPIDKQQEIANSIRNEGRTDLIDNGAYGIADKYRTPLIMDALLDLVKKPSDEVEKMGYGEGTDEDIYVTATDSRDARFAPYLASHATETVAKYFAYRMPKEAYENSDVEGKYPKFSICKYLLDSPNGKALVTPVQRAVIQESFLKRLRMGSGSPTYSSSGVAWACEQAAGLVRAGDQEIIAALKQQVESGATPDVRVSAMRSLGVGAVAGNSELIEYLKEFAWRDSNAVNDPRLNDHVLALPAQPSEADIAAQRQARIHFGFQRIQGVAVYALGKTVLSQNRPDLINFIKDVVLKYPEISIGIILDPLAEIISSKRYPEAEAALKDLANSGNRSAIRKLKTLRAQKKMD